MKLLNLYFENKTSTNSVNQVLVKFCLPTVGRRPTLSAGYKIPQGSGVTRDVLCTYCRT
jgi:hypothetical protein